MGPPSVIRPNRTSLGSDNDDDIPDVSSDQTPESDQVASPAQLALHDPAVGAMGPVEEWLNSDPRKDPWSGLTRLAAKNESYGNVATSSALRTENQELQLPTTASPRIPEQLYPGVRPCAELLFGLGKGGNPYYCNFVNSRCTQNLRRIVDRPQCNGCDHYFSDAYSLGRHLKKFPKCKDIHQMMALILTDKPKLVPLDDWHGSIRYVAKVLGVPDLQPINFYCHDPKCPNRSRLPARSPPAAKRSSRRRQPAKRRNKNAGIAAAPSLSHVRPIAAKLYGQHPPDPPAGVSSAPSNSYHDVLDGPPSVALVEAPNPQNQPPQAQSSATLGGGSRHYMPTAMPIQDQAPDWGTSQSNMHHDAFAGFPTSQPNHAQQSPNTGSFGADTTPPDPQVDCLQDFEYPFDFPAPFEDTIMVGASSSIMPLYDSSLASMAPTQPLPPYPSEPHADRNDDNRYQYCYSRDEGNLEQGHGTWANQQWEIMQGTGIWVASEGGSYREK